MSDNSFKDNAVFEDLVTDLQGKINQISSDGAYDSQHCYHISQDQGIKLVVLPRKGAVIEKHGNCHGLPLPRDVHIRQIRKSGRRRWKTENHYHRRSLSETAMYRFKTLLGDK